MTAYTKSREKGESLSFAWDVAVSNCEVAKWKMKPVLGKQEAGASPKGLDAPFGFSQKRQWNSALPHCKPPAHITEQSLTMLSFTTKDPKSANSLGFRPQQALELVCCEDEQALKNSIPRLIPSIPREVHALNIPTPRGVVLVPKRRGEGGEALLRT